MSRKTEKEKKEKMKVYELITMVNSIKSNSIPEDTKLRNINEVEARIFCDIYKKRPEEYCEKNSLSDELMLPSPFHKIYITYLLAMEELAAGEHEAYRTLMAEYEQAFSDYAKYCIRNR